MKKIINIILFSTLFSYSVLSFAIANPASVNCVKHGNQLVLIKNTGICIFPDATYCEEWAYLRGKCSQGQNAFPGGNFVKNKIGQYCIKRTGSPAVVNVIICP